MAQEGVEIQQRDQNSIAKEGNNSTKNPLNIDPGSVFNLGVKILSYRYRRLTTTSRSIDGVVVSSRLAEQEVRARFPVSPLRFQRLVISCFQVVIRQKTTIATTASLSKFTRKITIIIEVSTTKSLKYWNSQQYEAIMLNCHSRWQLNQFVLFSFMFATYFHCP